MMGRWWRRSTRFMRTPSGRFRRAGVEENKEPMNKILTIFLLLALVGLAAWNFVVQWNRFLEQQQAISIIKETNARLLKAAQETFFEQQPRAVLSEGGYVVFTSQGNCIPSIGRRDIYIPPEEMTPRKKRP